MDENIIAAAIRFDIPGNDYPQIMCGRRHSDVFELMYSLGVKYERNTHVQGFLTSNSRFVDRYEGFQIALAANQIKQEVLDDWARFKDSFEGCPLYSEDMW